MAPGPLPEDGRSYDMSAPARPITVTGYPDEVTVDFSGKPVPATNNRWLLEFIAVGGHLRAGTYHHAVGVSSSAPRYPRLNVSVQGIACHNPTGQFTITHIRFGPGRVVQRFDATFSQRCPNGAPLSGAISYRLG